MALVASGTYQLGYYQPIINVVGETLLMDIYGQDNVTFARSMGLLSFLFSLGCLVGLLLEG